MTTDHILESARALVSESLDDLRESIEGLPVDALNWRPTSDTNSIAAIVTHAMGAARVWFQMAMGLPLAERDLDAEFRASANDATTFGRFVADMSRDCLAALTSSDAVDWSALRNTEGRGGGAPPQVLAAYALIHATEHLRGHVDQVSLMRQLWVERSREPG
jgi:uncharacterized damage-inducible protein DinB